MTLTLDNETTLEQSGPVAPTDSPHQAFVDAYRDAIENADPTTGTIPAVYSDALRIAYRALGAKRVKLAADTTTAEMGAALDGLELETGEPITDQLTRLAAIRDASQHMSAADVKPTKTAVVIDPLERALAQVTALRAAESFLLAGFEESTRESILADVERVLAGRIPGYVIDWKAAGLPTTGARKSARAQNANRAPAGTLAELILAAITQSPEPMTAAMLNRACDRTGGAVPNAADKLTETGAIIRTTVKRGDRDVTAWVAA